MSIDPKAPRSPRPKLSGRCVWSGVLLLCTAGSAAQIARYSPQQVGPARPSAVEWIVLEAGAALAVGEPSTAPAALLVHARDALRHGTPEERVIAAIVLGLAKRRDDRALLSASARDPAADVAAGALVGMGFFGDTAARLHLAQILADRDAPTERRAVAAFALGLIPITGDEQGGSDDLKGFAQQLLRLSRSRHADELAACFIGFAPGEGRAVLEEYLRRNKVLSLGGQSGQAETMLRGIALAAFASRFAGDEEWILIRHGLTSQRMPTRRFLTAWGLYRHRGEGLDEKLKEKVARELARRLDDRSSAVRAMAMLAHSRFDPAASLKRARARLKRGRSRGEPLAATFLIVARLGSRKDLELLQNFGREPLEGPETAAWCLAAAEMSRRLYPAAWPFDATAGEGGAPFPLSEIRARLGTHLAPAGLTQAAAAIALAKLGDRASVSRMRELFFHAVEDRVRRIFALALLRIDAKALDEPVPPVEGEDASMMLRLIGWSHTAAPQLWAPLLARLKAADTGLARVEALRLAAVALAGPQGQLEDRVRRRVGPAPLPAPIRRILDWQ